MVSRFTPRSLPTAVSGLFQLNGYDVRGPIEKYGGEIDLCAVKTGDLFAEPIYIEVTVANVDSGKYAKDLTKLAAIREQEPHARLMIVSSTGFTPGVLGKAESAHITALTFDQLERRFQHFEPYIERTLTSGAEANQLGALEEIYEEPDFDDALGRDKATAWLTDWLTNPRAHRWLIVTGEYGTGKTALTQVLLRRWLTAYRDDPATPIPFRIELRAFTRQFDVRSLLHHFLDTNDLSHVPIDFVFSLIRAGRVVLLLDGYDEMAQYMHARERRACLEALAQLSADGARGILTSRPNYFTEAEELQVLDALYTTLEQFGSLTKDEATAVAEERQLDALFQQHFIERVERQLRDLTPEQTEELVARKLGEDAEAREVVIRLLRRIFRSTEEGASVALSGKPVIITYLLEIADGLKTDQDRADEHVTEWQVYDLVLRNLMIRDWRAAQEILPERRRRFLGRLALQLSLRDHSLVSDQEFADFVAKDFDSDLRLVPIETRDERLRQYVTDLRRSSTLTRATIGATSGSRFSHNSLREFVAAETLLAQLESDRAPRVDIPITVAMQTLVASRSLADIRTLIDRFGSFWGRRELDDGAGQLLSLLWYALMRVHAEEPDPVRAALLTVCGPSLDLGRLSVSALSLTGIVAPNLRAANFAQSTLSEVGFGGDDLSKANFKQSVLDEVDLSGCRLSGAEFRESVIFDVTITAAEVKGADFRQVDSISVWDAGRRFESTAAIGLLNARGALTDEVDPINVVRHHPKFEIARKVADGLLDGGNHQVRGLTQRGTATSDPRFARKFVLLLLNERWLTASQGRQLVQVTPAGREHIRPFAEMKHLTPEMARVFQRAL